MNQKFLNNMPDEVRQEGKQQQHEHSSHPDQKIERHFRRVDLLLVHAMTLQTQGS